jgi:hypothetical protein
VLYHLAARSAIILPATLRQPFWATNSSNAALPGYFVSFLRLFAGSEAMLNVLGLKVVGVTVFAHDSYRKNAMPIKQPTYVFAVVKKHFNS